MLVISNSPFPTKLLKFPLQGCQKIGSFGKWLKQLKITDTVSMDTFTLPKIVSKPNKILPYMHNHVHLLHDFSIGPEQSGLMVKVTCQLGHKINNLYSYLHFMHTLLCTSEN